MPPSSHQVRDSTGPYSTLLLSMVQTVLGKHGQARLRSDKDREPQKLPAYLQAVPTVIDVLKLVKNSIFQEPSQEAMADDLCLDCHENLKHHLYGLTCPSCRSHWWHLGRLERAGWQQAVFALRESAAPINYPIKGRPCPQCAVPMCVVHGPGPEEGGFAAWTRQRVDVCLGCDNLWLDPRELHTLDPDAEVDEELSEKHEKHENTEKDSKRTKRTKLFKREKRDRH
jgi:hypothetical protein